MIYIIRINLVHLISFFITFYLRNFINVFPKQNLFFTLFLLIFILNMLYGVADETSEDPCYTTSNINGNIMKFVMLVFDTNAC